MDLSTLRGAFAERKITKVKVGGFDVDGILRGKYISLDKFWGALEDGIGFCDVIFGWDVGDVLYDNAKITGWSTGYPDAHSRIDTSTFRPIPWEPGTAAFLLDFAMASNPEGVVLLSMYKPPHLSFALRRLTASPPPRVVLDLANRLTPSQAWPHLSEGMA